MLNIPRYLTPQDLIDDQRRHFDSMNDRLLREFDAALNFDRQNDVQRVTYAVTVTPTFASQRQCSSEEEKEQEAIKTYKRLIHLIHCRLINRNYQRSSLKTRLLRQLCFVESVSKVSSDSHVSSHIHSLIAVNEIDNDNFKRLLRRTTDGRFAFCDQLLSTNDFSRTFMRSIASTDVQECFSRDFVRYAASDGMQNFAFTENVIGD